MFCTRLLPRKANILFSLASKLKKPEQLCTAFEDSALLTASTSPAGKNEISIFVVKFIAVCHVGIHTHSIFCTLLLLICSRPGQNPWWCCKDTAPEWLSQHLPQLRQESACSSDSMLQAERPRYKIYLLQSAAERGNRKKTPNNPPNKKPHNLTTWWCSRHFGTAD